MSRTFQKEIYKRHIIQMTLIII